MSTETLLSFAQVQARVGLSHSEIYRRVRAGTFPKPLKLGPRCVRWRSSEIDSWIDALPRAKGDLGDWIDPDAGE